VSHVLVINFYSLLSVVEANDCLEIIRVVDLLDSVVMKKKILFFLLRKLNVKLSVALFFLHNDHFSNTVFKDLAVSYNIFSFLRDFTEQVLQANHVQWKLVERELEYLQHDNNEVLDTTALVGYTIHLFLYLL
jgi:hypothetical protein